MKTRKSILLMEEDDQTKACLQDMIRYYGMEADSVDSCAAAMRRLTEHAYDGLVLNMWMQDGTGCDVLTWLRQNGRHEPVVVISEDADYDQWIDLVNRGASDLLLKPVEPSQLKRALQMAMGEEYFTEHGWQTLGV